MDEKLLDSLPEEIVVGKDVLKKKAGRKNTEEARRRAMESTKDPLYKRQKRVAGRRNHFTDKEKMNAVCVFAVSGNSRRVSEVTGIPEGTIRSWKQTEWWNELMTRIRVEEDEELTTDLTKLINKAVTAVNDRLDNGDWIYNPRLDKLVRKPVGVKELAIVSAITIDKRQLLRGQPTSRVEKISTDERLKTLAEEFKKFTRATEVVQLPEDVEDAVEEGEITEGNIVEYTDGDTLWETEETGDSNSDDEGWEEQDELEQEDEEETLTVNEMFTE